MQEGKLAENRTERIRDNIEAGLGEVPKQTNMWLFPTTLYIDWRIGALKFIWEGLLFFKSQLKDLRQFFGGIPTGFPRTALIESDFPSCSGKRALLSTGYVIWVSKEYWNATRTLWFVVYGNELDFILLI